MGDKLRSCFQLRAGMRRWGEHKEPCHELTYRYAFANPAVRELLAKELAAWVAMQRQAGKPAANHPNAICIGWFTVWGYIPPRYWVRVLELPVVRERIAEDMVRLYGPGGVYELSPTRLPGQPEQRSDEK